MTIKDLYPILSPYQNLQIFDSRTGEPLTSVDYLADSGCEVDSYEQDKIYGITPRMTTDGDTYLAIMVELTV